MLLSNQKRFKVTFYGYFTGSRIYKTALYSVCSAPYGNFCQNRRGSYRCSYSSAHIAAGGLGKYPCGNNRNIRQKIKNEKDDK